MNATTQDSENGPNLSSTIQLPLPFSSSDIDQISRRIKSTKVVRLGDPAIPGKITKHGTYIAKLDHVWRAARTYAKRNNYKLLEMYGVIGVAPFAEGKVGAWLNYLNISYRPPLEVYQLYDKELTWIAESAIG